MGKWLSIEDMQLAEETRQRLANSISRLRIEIADEKRKKDKDFQKIGIARAKIHEYMELKRKLSEHLRQKNKRIEKGLPVSTDNITIIGELFGGKRRSDLNNQELREYNRVMQAKSRLSRGK